MKCSAFTIWLLTILMAAPSVASEVSLGIYEYPPFLGKDLERGGVLADLSQAIFIQAGYSTRQVSMPFARLVAAARLGEVDVIVGLWHTRERETQFLFSKISLLSTPVGFYKRRGISVPLRGHSNPLIVGMPRGYALPTEVDLTGLRLLTLDDDYQALNMVAKGRIDLAIISQDIADYVFKTQLKEEATQLEFVAPPLGVQHFYMAISRNLPNPQQLLGDFERAFETLLKQGAVQSIILHHGFRDFSSADIQ
tara:strand:- start:295 stop:1050 length:756 start_codon:yes stop_codon:yes gene_type:complete